MKKYISVFKCLGKISVMNGLEYRVNFVTMGIFRLIESATSFAVILLFVTITSGLGDWAPNEVLLVSLTFILTGSIIGFFLKLGIKQFSSDLNKGNIDKYLTKPLNLSFYALSYQWDWTQIFRIIGTIVAIVMIMNRLGNQPTLQAIFSYIVLVISALVLFCGALLIIVSSVLYLGRIKNIDYLAYIFWEPGKWPTSSFNSFWKIVFATVIPVWFVATVPVGALVGKYSFLIVPLSLIFSFSTLGVSQLFLKYGIRKYTGAGG